MNDDEALTFTLLDQPYTVTFVNGPTQNVSGQDLYLGPDFVVFTDSDGKVTAAFPAHTVVSIVPLAPGVPTGGAA